MSLLINRERPNITILTLNRPDKRNALNQELLHKLCEAVEQVEDRILILKGAGPVFCAGLDLQEASDLSIAENSAQLVARAITALYQSPAVTIASIHGAAMAGGAGLMSACDLVYSTPNTKIGFPETRRGLIPALVLTVLTRLVPPRHLNDLLLTAEPIDCEVAEKIGLINAIIPESEIESHILEKAEQILAGAPEATRQTKVLMRELTSNHFEEDIKKALAFHHQARSSNEAQERIAAFFNKGGRS